MTDWGDYGHTQPLCLSYPGIVTGAGFSWRVDSRVRALWSSGGGAGAEHGT